ncbi:uncharacterized protein BKCO1_1000122 [Diplodia corticola]|uniref:Uncharacterized protein n=1 Tax=Diplodia corticola TaxID=236234 RepID=A0A1J9S6E3_9PEZI|nr:uncharacterized protein BKCO1_1000122 [Diplodia corticola]OJD40507.1 hypothetical protein BKCO1_1000122 [Diplodia corticola]
MDTITFVHPSAPSLALHHIETSSSSTSSSSSSSPSSRDPTGPSSQSKHAPSARAAPVADEANKKDPSRPSFLDYLPMAAAASAIVGLTLLLKVVPGTPRVYERTWLFSVRRDGRWTARALTDPWISNMFLKDTLITLLVCVIASLLWNLFNFAVWCSRGTSKGIHPGVQIAFHLLFCLILMAFAIIGFMLAEADMKPQNPGARYWLSNVRTVYYAGPHDRGSSMEESWSWWNPWGWSLSEHSDDTNMSWRWWGMGLPDHGKHGVKLYLVQGGCVAGFILTVLHFLMFLRACYLLNHRRKKQRQELKDVITSQGQGRNTQGQTGV